MLLNRGVSRWIRSKWVTILRSRKGIYTNRQCWMMLGQHPGSPFNLNEQYYVFFFKREQATTTVTARERQTSNRFARASCIFNLYILCFRYPNRTWKYLILRFVEDRNTRQRQWSIECWTSSGFNPGLCPLPPIYQRPALNLTYKNRNDLFADDATFYAGAATTSGGSF